jgi:uncharacterized protein (TIGR02145 family)
LRQKTQCYDDKPDNCKKYGRLYDWGTALGACPPDWHLPSFDEWQTLVNLAGGDSIAGKKLKAKSGWEFEGKSNNGTDKYGFSALPGGECGFNCEDDYGGCVIGNFSTVGYSGNWWSATICEEPCGDSEGAHTMTIFEDRASASDNASYATGYLLSVRCIKD